MRRLHDMTNLEAGAKGEGEARCIGLPSGPNSAGRAAAVLENSCTAHECVRSSPKVLELCRSG